MRPAVDRNESVAMMEPLRVPESSRHRTALTDLALDLTRRAAGFRRSLPEGVTAALTDLVRSMNCYYSNLIEGHHTHPVEIEQALRDEYAADPEKRDLQREALTHVTVQKWIDEGGLDGRAMTVAGLSEVHRRFCGELPEDMLWVENPQTGERVRVLPGAYRDRDVVVGKHVAISPGAVPRFMSRFEQAHARMGATDRILAAATAHHRFFWIHPFADGNGRVARLMSHAVLREALDTGSIWSIARGLARNVDAYKQHLADCDQPRRNDLDGRGALSEEALAAFTRFFLDACIDQVGFMESLMQPNRLRARILLWAEEEIRLDGLPAKADKVLEAVLYRGELPRGELPALLGTGARQAARIVSPLVDAGVLTARSTRSPLRLAFPAGLAARWMPGLFPALPDGTGDRPRRRR